MSNEEARHENGPIEICGRFGQIGVDVDEETDSTLPPIRTPGSISEGQVQLQVPAHAPHPLCLSPTALPASPSTAAHTKPIHLHHYGNIV